jgi:RecG-like helicase
MGILYHLFNLGKTIYVHTSIIPKIKSRCRNRKAPYCHYEEEYIALVKKELGVKLTEGEQWLVEEIEKDPNELETRLVETRRLTENL